LNTDTFLNYLVIFLWLSYFPVSLVQVRAFFRNRKGFINTNLARIHNDPTITFQIMTRSAQGSDVVRRGIESVINSCKDASFSDYNITVITENPKDLDYVTGANVIVVPKEYKTQNAAIRKARALQYAVEQRKKAKDHDGDKLSRWIFHMDEESVVTSHTVLSLLTFIREKKGLISEGPIVYPYKIWDANRLTMLAESVRPFQCYECVSQMKHPPAIHMHGSNLLVREDVEDSVGWDNGQTVAEDQLFGFKVYERYGNIFGWHGGLLLEQPPLTIADHFRQRKRWIKGTLENLKYLPTKMKTKIYLRISSFWLGFLSALASTILYVVWSWPSTVQVIDWISFHVGLTSSIPVPASTASSLPVLTPTKIWSGLIALSSGKGINIPPDQLISTVASTVIGLSLIFTFVIWLVGTQVGLAFNLKNVKLTKFKRLSLHFQQLLFSPFVGLIETYPALVGLVEYTFLSRKRDDFHVVKK
jgi:egghead protein (zeste-white 4 protein)